MHVATETGMTCLGRFHQPKKGLAYELLLVYKIYPEYQILSYRPAQRHLPTIRRLARAFSFAHLTQRTYCASNLRLFHWLLEIVKGTA
jgi:hypothetical protein